MGSIRGGRGRIRIGVLALLACLVGPVRAGELEQNLKFAAEMAKQGNWREAHFRWARAAEIKPDDPRILNNLAVAEEALGERQQARKTYERALAAAPRDPVVSHNLDRSVRFWNTFGGHRAETENSPPATPADPRRVRGRHTLEVSVPFPLPPRLDLANRKTLLVASFLGRENEVLDSDRELVRLLRGEFHKSATLETLDVTPPPAIPEQRLEDLVKNVSFWRHLGREWNADVVVSGAVQYDRRDVSGYQDVDYVSEATGQKVRRTMFVEQEEFDFTVTVLFFDGRTGELLYRDRLARKVLFRGLNNDPITAFYEISEGLTDDIVAVVSPRRRIDSRLIYRG